MRFVFIGFFAFMLLAACSEQSRTLADHDTAVANDTDTAAVVDDDLTDHSDQSDPTDRNDDVIPDDIITDDEVGDDLLTDSDTPNPCRGLNPVQCSQTADCKGVSARRFRWGDKSYRDRANCIEEREWVGCFSFAELSCRDAMSGYSMVDANGQCWISDGCDPIWWKKPAPNDSDCHSEEEGNSWPEIANCGTRFCDDGSEINCQMGMPWYCELDTAIVALQDGCWTCVDPLSCLPPEAEDHCDSPNVCGTHADCPLGYACTAMLSCNNAEWGACEPHQCPTQSIEAHKEGLPPDCGQGVLTINDGYWLCVDIVSCLPQE